MINMSNITNNDMFSLYLALVVNKYTSFKYKVMIILKGHDEYIHIIDYILPKDEKVYDLVLNKIYHFCWQIALKVSLIVNEKSHFYDYLKRCGFERQEKYFEPIVYFNNPFFNQDWFKDVDNYYFTMGDNDVF